MSDKSVFEKEYSEESFWDKVTKYAKIAGRELIELALQFYYTLQNPNTPMWAKAIIIGALGYFISPLDAIPDVIPGIGYADDMGILAAAAATIAAYITDEIKEKARVQVDKFFD